MDTGIRRSHLYSACQLTATHLHGSDYRKSGTATGFLVQLPALNKFALVTNRHVVDLPWADPVRYEGFSLESLSAEIWMSPDMRMTYELTSLDAVYHDDDTIDVCAILLPFHDSISAQVTFFGEPVPENFQQLDESAQKDHLKKFAERHGIDVDNKMSKLPEHFLRWDFLTQSQDYWHLLEVGEMAFFPGYPFWYDKSQGRPVMRSGVLMSDPQKDIRVFAESPSPTDGRQQVLFEAFSTDGNSGSPVFAAQKIVTLGWENGTDTHPPLFLGINAGHLKDEDHRHVGASRMYKASTVLDVLRKL